MNLREMGVGDLSVGKRVKSMARAFYGRSAAYDAAFDTERDAAPDAADEESLKAALRRNIYGAHEPNPGALALLLGYVQGADDASGKRNREGVRAGAGAAWCPFRACSMQATLNLVLLI